MYAIIFFSIFLHVRLMLWTGVIGSVGCLGLMGLMATNKLPKQKR